MRYSAVLLAGGKSTRMGRDKALLEIDGQPLWQQQLETLRRLSPEQLMIAGPPHLSSRAERSEVEGSRGVLWKRGSGSFQEAPRDPSTPPPAPLGMTIADEMQNAGPLAGIAAAFHRCTSPLLLVLAVDLPQMTTAFLRSLLLLCRDGKGVVPRGPKFFEALAAVYPVAAADLADEHLRRNDFSMQNFVRAALGAELLAERNLAAEEHELFTNLNTPADL